MTILTEHSTKIKVKLPSGDVQAQMEVFYNPIMASNRNIAILLLRSLPHQKMKLADPLAGSGIRALRMFQEVPKKKIDSIAVNDHKENFLRIFKENTDLNKIYSRKISAHSLDASLFLLHQEGFDYIDLDPFGSPNPYLGAAIARISRKGILAVTATDTAALTGTYTSVTRRKYWAEPLRNYLMHEIGLRILIRKIQLLGTQFDKALVPILSYSKDHYYRLYFQCEKGKEKCDAIVRQHQYFLFCNSCLNFKTSPYNWEKCSCGGAFQFAGPLWSGALINQSIITTIAKNNPFPEEQKFLDLLQREATIHTVGFYDLHEVASHYKLDVPKIDLVVQKTAGVRTTFSPTGVRCTKSLVEMLKIMKSLGSKIK